jgi:hypothetical protein
MSTQSSGAEETVALLKHLGIEARASVGTHAMSLTLGPYLLVNHSPNEDAFATRKRVIAILARFYKERQPKEFECLLIVRRIGVFGDCLVTNMGADTLDLLSPDLESQLLLEFDQEFRKLNSYLASLREV